MSELQPSDFSPFFTTVYGHEPFPWQRMLVARVAERGWPEGIDLPTASGKTACIDAAVFILALGERCGRLSSEDPARRRIFFVVDRRIVVDEAYDRAKRLARVLRDATDGILKTVADRLRALAGPESSEPLVVSRLRGGTVKDEAWRLSPAQPAIITSTVDQTGSRLLFRSYGSGSLSVPIEAALSACDSLILLDEAHCAAPFLQTARAVHRYGGQNWIEDQAIAPPLTFAILSATLPPAVTEVFPSHEERSTALDHPELQKRIMIAKLAELVEVTPKKARTEALVAEATKRAVAFAEQGHQRIVVMVNRVATATEITLALQDEANGKSGVDADIVLMTGRMRPVDRDVLVDRWTPLLKAGNEEQPERPIILVTTQCLEVGADFSFDALITECASLDALRQRFGRLNRLGEMEAVDSAVLMRRQDQKPDNKLDDSKLLDPVYGNSMARTWNWLKAHAKQAGGTEHFDFGTDALEQALPADKADREELLALLAAPSADAPVMLPAHVDLLCQTAPRPAPDPEVALFLHGPQPVLPEVQVVFRADLVDPGEAEWQSKWCDTVAMLPPLAAEALTVPLWLIRKWLAGKLAAADLVNLSDVKGQQPGDGNLDGGRGEPFVIWRGKRNSRVALDPKDVQPNDTIIVQADEDLAAQLGNAFCRSGDATLDVAEQAYQSGRHQHVLRLVHPVLQHGMPAGLADVAPVKELLSWAQAEDEGREDTALDDLISAVDGRDASLPEWLNETLGSFQKSKPKVQPHPAGGLVLIGAARDTDVAPLDLDFGDMDDALSAADQPVPLALHTQHVVKRAKAWAERCLPPELAGALETAARFHDAGKADPRFQTVLYGDEPDAAAALSNGKLLAKSDGLNRPWRVQQRLREAARLPVDFRHEMLSMQIAEAVADQLPGDDGLRELVLHLIASHHGHGRPFAPVCIDERPPPVPELPDLDIDLVQSAEWRGQLVPSHRLDSGVAERFWKLTRRFGWWGLAYLETILRLADRAASSAEAGNTSQAMTMSHQPEEAPL